MPEIVELPVSERLPLPPGQYSVNFGVPELLLDRANKNPTWTQHVAEYVFHRANRGVKVIGGGVIWDTVPGTNLVQRFYAITFDTLDTGTRSSAAVSAAVVPFVTLGVIVAAVAAVLVSANVVKVYQLRLDYAETPTGKVSAWGGLVARGALLIGVVTGAAYGLTRVLR